MASRSDMALRRVCAATLAQLRALLPSSGGETSRRLLGRTLFLLTDAVQTLSAPTATRATTLTDHLHHRGLARPMIDELTASVVGNDSEAVLAPQAERLFSDLEGELISQPLPAQVETLFGIAKLVDYLRGVLIEACTLALEHGRVCPDQALSEASRALSTVLAYRHPGATIEVRVPPAVAVQIGALGTGSSHTRGTPPNVVETSPRTFVALAVGQLTWDEASSQRLVQASGTHAADLGQMLPVWPLSR